MRTEPILRVNSASTLHYAFFAKIEKLPALKKFTYQEIAVYPTVVLLFVGTFVMMGSVGCCMLPFRRQNPFWV